MVNVTEFPLIVELTDGLLTDQLIEVPIGAFGTEYVAVVHNCEGPEMAVTAGAGEQFTEQFNVLEIPSISLNSHSALRAVKRV